MPHSKSDKGHFLPFLSFNSVSHGKVQDKKGVVKAESIVPIHTKTDIPQKTCPSDKPPPLFHLHCCRGEGQAGLGQRGRGPSAEGWSSQDRNLAPRATLPGTPGLSLPESTEDAQ